MSHSLEGLASSQNRKGLATRVSGTHPWTRKGHDRASESVYRAEHRRESTWIAVGVPPEEEEEEEEQEEQEEEERG